MWANLSYVTPTEMLCPILEHDNKGDHYTGNYLVKSHEDKDTSLKKAVKDFNKSLEELINEKADRP